MERQGTTSSGDGAGAYNHLRGVVHGPVVQAGRIHGDVHVHHHVDHAPRPPAPARDRAPFDRGPEVDVDGVAYLVHDHPAEARPTGDAGAVLRQARCLRLTPPGGLGWLRQVEVRHATPSARRARQALVDEHRLLARGIAGLPAVLQFAEGPGAVVTLVTSWPRTRTGRPCDTLDVLLPGGPVRDAGVLARVCDALAGLCATLAGLHAHRVAHGALAPDRLVWRDDGTLLVRDLARTDEGLPEYPAPEQWARAAAGPWTDVHQVGAIAHHLLAGRPPAPRAPLPLRSWAPDVDDRLAAAVDAALSPDPAARPDAAALGGWLRGFGGRPADGHR
ncbi:hypothetical protein [Saccharothrix australiensis]|uniref:Protein kinase domain-containing protein n=1 Tax=Saccharothrix australiensis TaxID=2072 RepID=A0A495VWL8_9PSEU|nr:hypothetical protein [Saccharothrix australiensis]RKT53801.1 hypothetical protein C8E97_2383 [Saccharothrix australiensis]